jgi:TspO/MBR family
MTGAFFRPGEWYERLKKPSWRPPNRLFAPVWTILYLMIAVSGLEPLLDGGILRMTVPDKPTSSKQRYVLTDAGLKLKSLRLDYGKVSTKKEESE